MALPTTDLEVVNLALDNLSHTVSVVSLTADMTPEARAARRWLDVDRDRALASFPWKWAEKRALLVAATGQTHERWEYFYTPPTDMVPGTGRFWSADSPNPLPEDQEPFEEILSAAGTGRVIGCNIEAVTSEAPVLFYTMRVTNVALYPQEFVNFFAWLLASDLAKPVAKDATGRMRITCLQEAKLALDEAKVSALSGRREYPAPVTPSVAARS